MNAKKIGLLCLALVLALGALGVGYAKWTDTVNITGHVNTGNVDIEVDSVSNTYCYKVLSTGAIVFSPTVIDNADYLLVASAVTTYCGQDVTMTFDNLFPTETGFIKGDVVMHYVGSIPAHIILTNVVYTPTVGPNMSTYMHVEWYKSENGGVDWVQVDPATAQLHNCHQIKLWVWFDFPQDAALMNASGTLSGSIEAYQWNE